MADDLQVVLESLCEQIHRLQASLHNARWTRPTTSTTNDSGHGPSPTTTQLSFDAADADIILKSSDGIEFRVFKRILSEGSIFFQTMFTLPSGDAHPSTPETPPVVDLAETSQLVSSLLGFLYPIPDPPVQSLSELNDLLAISCKYEMMGVLHTLRKLLVSDEFTARDPFAAFTIAVRHQLVEEIKIAASRTFSVSLLEMPITDDHRYITGYEFFQLIKLHRKRAKEFIDIVKSTPAIKCPGCSRRNGDPPPNWWKDWESRASLEIQQRPCTKIVFSQAFIAKSAKAAIETTHPCFDCPLHILNSQPTLDALRMKLDSLPINL